MKNLVLENFRLFQNRTQFDLEPITILTGKNNSGKSSVFKALLLLSDFLESKNQTKLDFEGRNKDKHFLSTFGNAKTRSLNDFFSINYHNEYLIVELKFEGKDNDKTGLLKSFKITTVENNQHLILKRLSESIFDLSFTPAFFHAFEHTLTGDFLVAGETYDLNALKDSLNDLNINIKSLSSLTVTKDNFLISDELNKLNARKKMLQSQIKRIQGIYEGSLFEFSATIDTNLPFQGDALRIEDIIYNGIKYHLGKAKLNELKTFYQKKIDKKFDFNRTLITFIRELNNRINYRIHYMSVIRFHPAEYYSGEDKNQDLFNELKKYSIAPPAAGSGRMLFLKHWLKEFGIGIDLKIENIDETLFFPEVRVLPEDKFIKIAELGYGSGQLLPILLKVINNAIGDFSKGEIDFIPVEFTPGGNTIIIEEPEANLHPKIQSKLAEMFYDAWKKFGIKFILETHSEYMIRSFQAIINEQQHNSFLKIYYLDKNAPYEMKINNDGTFENEFGEGFFDEAARQAFKIL